MATGYTADVGSGKVTEFRDFAMACARAFGACITMRDDPIDAEIPDEFTPDDYYARSVNDAKAALVKAQAMTLAEAVEDLAKHNASQANDRQRLRKESVATRQRYEAMLAKVIDWTPPTHEHERMKGFMVEQLQESINFDCHDDGGFPERCYPSFEGTASEWLERKVHVAAEELVRAKKRYAEEVERCRSRSEWVNDLRRSLGTKTSGGLKCRR